MQKRLFGMILLILAVSLALMGCHYEVLKKGEEMTTEAKDLECAVPEVSMYKTTAHQLTVEEVEQNNEFFSKVKEFTGVERRSNPITLTGEEFNRIPKAVLNHPIPENIKFFRSCFYNSPDHSLKSKTGIFVSQAILYGNKADADIGEESMIKKIKSHFKDIYRIICRKGNIVAGVNMFEPNVGPTKELQELVNFLKSNGFSITELKPETSK